MALRDWLEPPRRLIALFLLVTLVPSLALIASGWRLLEQDRRLSLSQLSERREQAIDLAVSELEHLLASAEHTVGDPQSLRSAAASDDDAVGVTFGAEHVDAFPKGRLTFYPRSDAGSEAPAARFAEAEHLEFRQQALPDATRAYRSLAQSADRALRAGALIRLARVFRKTGDSGKALDAYAELGHVSGVAVGGVPADLLARWARCDLLESLQRRDDLQREAFALQADLVQGRWHLDRATYDLHVDEVSRWTGTRTTPARAEGRPALASAVETLWNDWQRQASDRSAGVGRRVITTSSGRVTVVWTGTRERLSALLLGSAFVERQWLARIKPALDRQHLRLELRDAARDAAGQEARRAAVQTGLPWDVVVSDVDPQGELTRIAGRRALWLWGLVLLLGVTAGGVAIITRLVVRDLAVARLQSDFVSAVSHEFRTPLTSLRQLTEVLLDGRVAADDRREKYYRALARQTERLHRLVESLLDFGRMEAGTSPYRLEPLDACALIRSVVDEFEQDSAANGHHVELHEDGIEGTAPTLAGDREALTHAVWNLLDNAVKYSPECRTVWVDVERAGSRIAIRVRDRGLGVPRHEQADIFRRFVRGADAKTHGIKGTGIGLAMVRHIVAAHGGDVLVASEPGAGSTFTILLPVKAQRHGPSSVSSVSSVVER
jgi:signal transduction histidine kinase